MLLDWTFFLIFRKTGRHLFLQGFKFGKAMYIIRNKIRVICSKIRVGMEGGPFSLGGVHISQGNMDPRVHIQWGPIFDLTPASMKYSQYVYVYGDLTTFQLLHCIVPDLAGCIPRPCANEPRAGGGGGVVQ